MVGRGSRGDRTSEQGAGEARLDERLDEVVRERGGGGEVLEDLVLVRARDVRVVDTGGRVARPVGGRAGETQRGERLDEVVRDRAGGEALGVLRLDGAGEIRVGGENGRGERHGVERADAERRGERGVGALAEKLRAWRN